MLDEIAKRNADYLPLAPDTVSQEEYDPRVHALDADGTLMGAYIPGRYYQVVKAVPAYSSHFPGLPVGIMVRATAAPAFNSGDERWYVEVSLPRDLRDMKEVARTFVPGRALRPFRPTFSETSSP